MSVEGVGTAMAFEGVLAWGGVALVRRARRHRKDRRASETLATLGAAGCLLGLAVGIPAVLVAHSLAVVDAAVVLLACGLVGTGGSKPVGWLEERRTAKAQRAAGIPVAQLPIPAWVVAFVDMLVSVVVTAAVLAGLAALGQDEHQTPSQLEAASSAAGIAVLVVGVCLATGHYFWQARRIRRAAWLHRQSNDQYLA